VSELSDRPAELLESATAWAAQDPDPATRTELDGLVTRAEAGDHGALAELADSFSGTLEFGTAGLRGRLGPGPNRMNRVVVSRAAAGLAGYLRERSARGPDGKTAARPIVVIGYDARHNSDVFARDTAEIVTGAGLDAVLLPRALPTPVLAFAIRRLGAAAGVMVTASHNPAADNGYKVYLGDGRQIVPPADAEIAAAIRAVAAVGPVARLPRDPAAVEIVEVDGPDGLLTAYRSRVIGLVGAGGPGRGDLQLVTTALHGVGAPVLAAVLAGAGFGHALPVAAQEQPDPDFPTTPFPNPEEPGVLDLAVAAARESTADLVLACDPDADRCAVAVPDETAVPDKTAVPDETAGPDEQPGPGGQGWRRLSGDEVGSLLAWRVLTEQLPPLRTASAGAERTVLAATIVSSTQIDALAARAGAPLAHTLTGFKWLSRVPGLRFGYEEAIGYCLDPAAVADKDGISACLVVADLAARLRAGELPAIGTRLTDVLAHIDAVCGVVATDQLSIRVTVLSRRDELLAALAADPPTALGGLDVRSIDDLDAGVDGLPPTPGLRLNLGSAQLTGRVVVRPSGTEPKLKCYLQVAAPADPDVPAARARARTELAAVFADLRDRLG
jgi:phosphomannomutase